MFSHRRAPRAFTLIEIVVCMCLVVLLLGLGVPSLTGQSRMSKLQTAYDRFGAFVVRAQQQSARDNKPYVLSWGRKGTVRLLPAEATDDEGKRNVAVATFTPLDGEQFTLERPASLVRQPRARWTFWPTGNCEPVNVRYRSRVGTWAAAFSPLSGRGTIQQMVTL